MQYESRGQRFREAYRRILANTSEVVWDRLYNNSGRVIKCGWPQYLGDEKAIWIDIVAYRDGTLKERTTHFSNIRNTSDEPEANQIIDATLDGDGHHVYIIGDVEETFVDIPLEEYPDYATRIKEAKEMMDTLAGLLKA